MTSIAPRSGVEVDSWPFMFASGFAFGIALSLLFLAFVVAAIEDGGVSVQAIANTSAAINSIGAALFGLIVGSALYLLAFPENREWFESSSE